MVGARHAMPPNIQDTLVIVFKQNTLRTSLIIARKHSIVPDAKEVCCLFSLSRVTWHAQDALHALTVRVVQHPSPTRDRRRLRPSKCGAFNCIAGTSVSTAHFAEAVALLLEHHPRRLHHQRTRIRAVLSATGALVKVNTPPDPSSWLRVRPLGHWQPINVA